MTADSKARRLAGARKGGRQSAELRREHVESLEAFRDALLSRLQGHDAILQSLVDSACALYAVILKRSKLSVGVNRRVNPLQISAAVTSFRSVLRELGALRGNENVPEAPESVAEYIQRKAQEKAES